MSSPSLPGVRALEAREPAARLEDLRTRAKAVTHAFASEWPYEPHFLEVAGQVLHYVDEGPRDAPPILCVHGNPTWGFFYRALIERFSKTHRVIAVDHLGCGLSQKPKDGTYRLADHISRLLAVVRALDLQNTTLVVHDWGGPIGLGTALSDLDRFERIAITNTGAFPGLECPLRIRVCRIPLLGALGVRGLNLFAGRATTMAVARGTGLQGAVKAGFLAPYGSWADRIAVQRFVEDIPLAESHPSYPTLAALGEALPRLAKLPIGLLWGEKDWCFTPKFREEFQRRLPGIEVQRLERAGHYLFEDDPEASLAWLARFLQLDAQEVPA